MNVSKSLASAVAAMAVVGSIGFAYAQTTTSDPAMTTSPSQSMDRNSPMNSTSPSTMPNSATTDNSTLSNELAPQADRG